MSLYSTSLFGQLQSVKAQVTTNLKEHITYLASDSLHGRMTGSEDERKAAAYITGEFKKYGIANYEGNFDAKKYLQGFEFNPTVDSVKTHVSGNNVVAYINNHAKHTIIIGAHYDHLGWGDPKHSTYRGEPAVHHGADDNASGVSAMLEIARELKNSSLKNNNYVFIAFSGEELGLYGSKWFADHPGFDLKQADYMLNFDMVGRLDSTSQTLILGGTGTSPTWKEVIEKIQSPLHIKSTESGVGPSDHTSFYLKDIPVLFFFTGQHKDYHKPSDVESKINYGGMELVIKYAMDLLTKLNDKDKLAFTKTKDDSNDDVPKFKVTLGVMPDYTYDGEGMRIDAVTDGKPASKAGLLAGDVVIQLGDVKVTEMMSYMKALGQFKKGDTSKVKVKRGKEIIEKDVQF
ncbi:MAG: peptidase [Bacteroidota bacterium]|nr:peptidase [Bacteroidota bacterium]